MLFVGHTKMSEIKKLKIIFISEISEFLIL